MPSYVITEKCDGCKGQDRTACLYICPNDLYALDKEAMKAYEDLTIQVERALGFHYRIT